LLRADEEAAAGRAGATLALGAIDSSSSGGAMVGAGTVGVDRGRRRKRDDTGGHPPHPCVTQREQRCGA
jgi:hypothetical protein